VLATREGVIAFSFTDSASDFRSTSSASSRGVQQATAHQPASTVHWPGPLLAASLTRLLGGLKSVCMKLARTGQHVHVISASNLRAPADGEPDLQRSMPASAIPAGRRRYRRRPSDEALDSSCRSAIGARRRGFTISSSTTTAPDSARRPCAAMRGRRRHLRPHPGPTMSHIAPSRILVALLGGTAPFLALRFAPGGHHSGYHPAPTWLGGTILAA